MFILMCMYMNFHTSRMKFHIRNGGVFYLCRRIVSRHSVRLQSSPGSLMVTPRDIDQQVRDLGKVIGYGINWALQDLEIEEINALLS